MAFTIRHTATALTAATLALCGSAIAAEKTLKIYGFGAKSGVVGIFGQQSEAAMQAAANIINKNGGCNREKWLHALAPKNPFGLNNKTRMKIKKMPI